MAGLERLAEPEPGALEATLLKGDGEVGTRSTVVIPDRTSSVDVD